MSTKDLAMEVYRKLGKYGYCDLVCDGEVVSRLERKKYPPGTLDPDGTGGWIDKSGWTFITGTNAAHGD